MIPGMKPSHCTGGKRLVDALIDRRPRYTQCVLNLRRRVALSVSQQHLCTFDFALRRGAGTREFTQHSSVLPTEHQRRPPSLSCHAGFRKDVLEKLDRRGKHLRKAFGETKYQ